MRVSSTPSAPCRVATTATEKPAGMSPPRGLKSGEIVPPGSFWTRVNTSMARVVAQVPSHHSGTSSSEVSFTPSGTASSSKKIGHRSVHITRRPASGRPMG